jgi:hypothetical protein
MDLFSSNYAPSMKLLSTPEPRRSGGYRWPLSLVQVVELLEALKDGHTLHARVLMELVEEAIVLFEAEVA